LSYEKQREGARPPKTGKGKEGRRGKMKIAAVIVFRSSNPPSLEGYETKVVRKKGYLVNIRCRDEKEVKAVVALLKEKGCRFKVLRGR